MSLIIVIIIGLALSFSFMNGVHDSRNVVATMISSRAYPPRIALGITALAEFCGPFIFGVAVAQTIGRDIVQSSAVTEQVLVVALSSALAWNLLTWIAKLPSSSSHALIGGLLGAASMRAGPRVIQTDGLLNILISLFASPIIGFFIGFLLLRLVMQLSQDATPRINEFFKRSQLLTALILGLSHGSNDGQKSMGIITLALVTAGTLSTFVVPLWVVALCALALALGTAVGGWRLIHTVGGVSFYKIRPVDGFSSQVASALVILIASLAGGPVSATQVINSSIMGIGVAERANKVRWGLVQDIVIAWVLTIPATTFLSAGIYLLTSRFLF
ncbi:MAG: anion permease [Anaerolineaceae bacterium]|nr:MAG: anion permease [Anaerolineaceae bacterium]